MKQFISITLSAIFVLFTSLISAQNLTFHPSDCSPGDQVEIKYNLEQSNFESLEGIEFVAYQITDDGLMASELVMEKIDDHYKATISTSPKAMSMFIRIVSGDSKKKDDNEGKGYGIKMKTADKSGKIQGAYASVADAYTTHARAIGVKRDYAKAVKYLQKEFKHYPEQKKEAKSLRKYAYNASKAKDEAVINEVKSILAEMQHSKDKSEDHLMLVHYLQQQTGQNKEAETTAETIKDKYPEGKMVTNNLTSKFFDMKDLDQKLEAYGIVAKRNAGVENFQNTLDMMVSSIANDYGKAENWNKYDLYNGMIKDNMNRARSLNSIAWSLSGESLEADAPEAKRGAEYSKLSMELINSVKDDAHAKPGRYTQKQWKNQLDYSYAMYSDTYALLQYHNGNYEDAFKFQKVACKKGEFNDSEMNERFCVYAEKAYGPEKAEKKLQWLIKDGKATGKMKDQYQRIFMANNTLETAYKKHIAALESVARDKLKVDLKEKMISEKAPEFQLVNLKGEKVSLADMKGKVVVLDFWATWCGPCKISFPGMQKVVDNYSKNDDVAFLFLDTWERGDNKEENASKFIDKHGYTFNVLMDNDNKVVADYKVSGIPTKFIVDKNGMIRFKSVGYQGSLDGLVSELELMIEMATEASSGDLSSAP